MTDKERLVNEWTTHGKIVLAVDYDDTIFHWRHTSQERCDEILQLVKWVKSIGAYIMIHTSSDITRYKEIRDYCYEKGLIIDSINENPIILPYGSRGKPYYNWQLCDRSGLDYAVEVLNEAAKEVLTMRQEAKKLKDFLI